MIRTLTKSEFKKLYESHTQIDLATKLGVTVQTIYRYAKKLDLKKGRGKGGGRPAKFIIK